VKRPVDKLLDDIMQAAEVADELVRQFVFVTDYPASVRPFYHLRPAGDPTVTSSFDLIMKLLDLLSIREATLFFRGPNRLAP
jgi:aspartyl/asparaginyl-tRNA synthetase